MAEGTVHIQIGGHKKRHGRLAEPRHMIVSGEDADLGMSRWTIDSHGYACRIEYLGDYRRRRYVAHRVILSRMLGRKLCRWDITDHINHDKLDNRRENLRLVDQAGNLQNRAGLDASNTSGHRGVTWHRRHRKWYVTVIHRGVRHFGGLFTTVDAASLAAEALRKRLGCLSSVPSLHATEGRNLTV
jgi:hypothetical protein